MSYNFDEDMQENSFDILKAACSALTQEETRDLETVLALHGIASSFIEYSGQTVAISLLDRWDILHLKGVHLLKGSRIDHDKLLQEKCSLLESHWHSVLPASIVIDKGVDTCINLRFSRTVLEYPKSWKIEWETGCSSTGEFVPALLEEVESAHIDGKDFSVRRLFLPGLDFAPLGYHKLTVSDGDTAAESSADQCTLIVTPSRCYEPDWVSTGKRVWGISVQLYAVRSETNWGIGDFSDLSRLVSQASSHGAGFLVLNPLHALDNQRPHECSPYSPNDRRRLNILYIDPTVEPEYLSCPKVQNLISTMAWKKALQKLRSKGVIDYTEVSRKKRKVLGQMYAFFVEKELEFATDRAKAFLDYVAREGEALALFAHYETHREFPVGTSSFERDPRFIFYTQWLAEMQLEACQTKTRALGMSVGLIRDLAVGSNAGGAEVVENGQLFCRETSVGAPPDPLAPQGQNWGLPPMDPTQMKATGYQHFVNLLRTNMSHCGALRIDHVMALMRLWWCPRFEGRGNGSYVTYPVAELFAILRLESQRSRCVVIGEDLGVVPPEIRGYLNSSGVYSNVLFYFEKYDGYHFKKPEHYNFKALAMVANHDVPTVAAWWNGSDLVLRRNLELLESDEELESQLAHRSREREQVLHLLQDQWLLPENWSIDKADDSFDYALCAAIFRLNARANAQMVSVQLEDLTLFELPVNIPGTSSEYPNWQRKLPYDIERMFVLAIEHHLLEGFLTERG